MWFTVFIAVVVWAIIFIPCFQKSSFGFGIILESGELYNGILKIMEISVQEGSKIVWKGVIWGNKCFEDGANGFSELAGGPIKFVDLNNLKRIPVSLMDESLGKKVSKDCADNRTTNTDESSNDCLHILLGGLLGICVASIGLIIWFKLFTQRPASAGAGTFGDPLDAVVSSGIMELV
jgi:hypothetical protein